MNAIKDNCFMQLNKKKMNVIHINSYYITNKLHGELVKKLDEKGLVQTVFIPVENKNKIGLNTVENLKNSELIFRHCFNTLTRYFWPLKMLQIWFSFKKIADKIHSPTIIHAHSLIVNGLIAYFSSYKYNIPYVVTVRNTDINTFLKFRFIFGRLAAKILQKADSVLFISPAYRDVHLKKVVSTKLFEEILPKTHIIPNAIESLWIKNINTSNNNKSNEINSIIKILFSGKIDDNKNIMGLIDACDLMFSQGYDIQVSIVGEGPLLNSLKRKKYPFEVIFYGYINSRKKLLDVYRSNHILVVPSFYETFGVVYPEAMSQGLPVIYTKNQGFDGYFPDGYIGYSINPSCPKDISEKIKLIIANYQRISENALFESEKFSWDIIAEDILKMYSSSIIRNP